MRATWLPVLALVAVVLVSCGRIADTAAVATPAEEPATATAVALDVMATAEPTMVPTTEPEPTQISASTVTPTSAPANIRDDRGINPLRDITIQGLTYAMEEDYDKAIVEFTKVIQSNPQNWAAYLLRGQMHAANGDYAKAISDHSRAIFLNPESSEAYSSRGVVHSEAGDHDSAVADFDKAIELNPENAQAYFGRGAILTRTDEYERGILDLDRAIELNPNQPSAFRMRGIAYATNKADYERAISDFDSAIALDAADAETYLGRGLAWFLSEKYDEAIEDFDVAIALNPELDEPLDYRKLSEVLRDGSLMGWSCTQQSEWLKVGNDDTIVDIYDVEETYRSPERMECIGRAQLRNGGDAAITFQMKSNGDNSHELIESLPN